MRTVLAIRNYLHTTSTNHHTIRTLGIDVMPVHIKMDVLSTRFALDLIMHVLEVLAVKRSLDIQSAIVAILVMRAGKKMEIKIIACQDPATRTLDRKPATILLQMTMYRHLCSLIRVTERARMRRLFIRQHYHEIFTKRRGRVQGLEERMLRAIEALAEIIPLICIPVELQPPVRTAQTRPMDR
jgi:hypothetical protein